MSNYDRIMYGFYKSARDSYYAIWSRFEIYYFFPSMGNYFEMKTSLLLTHTPCKY